MHETLVFIAGTLCDERVFTPQLSHFEDRYHCQVIIPQGAETIEDMARLALDSIAAPSFNVIGFSLGGILAMAMVPLAQGRIKRLALLNTNHLPDTSERKIQRLHFVNETRAGKFHDVLRHEIQHKYLGRLVHDKTEMLNEILGMALAVGPACYCDQMMAARERMDATEQIKTYEGATLILCGEDDIVCPAERHYAMRALMKNSTCITIPMAGHYSTLEAPDAVNNALETWLARPISE